MALGLVALVLPAGLEAQLREIVAKRVSASSSGAALELQLAEEGDFELRFEDGAISLGDETLGSYEDGSALDAAWRSLLGEAMGLENGPLAELLVAWTPPGDLTGDAAEAARAVDEALEGALETTASQAAPDRAVSVSTDDERALVRLLLGTVGRLSILEEALAGIRSDFRVHVDEDVVVAEGEVVEGTLVVIEGTVRIEGEVRGDVVVVDGALEVMDSGVVRGAARIADARVLRNAGEVEGGIVDVLEEERDRERALRDSLREEIREEVRRNLGDEIRNVTRMEHDDGFSIMSPLRPVIRGIGGVLEKLILIFVLGLVGAGFLAFAGDNVETIAETARRSPGRAAMVGLAGSFLLIPVWILGLIALLVSIIGIPVAIAWAPLFPLAAGLAALLGYLAVALNAGEWLADSNFPWTGWIRKSNPVYALFAGLVGLLLAFMVGHVISIAPFLDFLSGLLFAVGVMVTIAAVLIGFGAVLLTRGGRKREHYGAYDPDAAWEAAMSVEVDDVGPSAGGTGAGTEDEDGSDA